MSKIEMKNYDHLKEIEWWRHVSNIGVTLHDKKLQRTTKFFLRVEKDETLFAVLVANKVIKNTAEIKDLINQQVQDNISAYVKSQVNRYEKGVRVYNELIDLDIKDKRTYSCGEAYEGKIKKSEIDFEFDYEYKLAYHEQNFKIKMNCPYSYDWSNKQTEYIYKEDECIVLGGAFDLELALELRHDITLEEITGDRTHMVKVPNAKLSYKLKEQDNTIKEVCLINACTMSHKWMSKQQKRKYTFKFQSYFVSKDSREVGLNTFIVYCREQSQLNRERFIQEVKESVNQEEMLKQLKDAWGEENVSITTSHRSDVNFNYNKYWGRYSTKSVKIMLKDKSYLLYSFDSMIKHKELDMLGLYDSTYEKESLADAFKRVLDTNKVDKNIANELMNNTLKNDKDK